MTPADFPTSWDLPASLVLRGVIARMREETSESQVSGRKRPRGPSVMELGDEEREDEGKLVSGEKPLAAGYLVSVVGGRRVEVDTKALGLANAKLLEALFRMMSKQLANRNFPGLVTDWPRLLSWTVVEVNISLSGVIQPKAGLKASFRGLWPLAGSVLLSDADRFRDFVCMKFTSSADSGVHLHDFLPTVMGSKGVSFKHSTMAGNCCKLKSTG